MDEPGVFNIMVGRMTVPGLKQKELGVLQLLRSHELHMSEFGNLKSRVKADGYKRQER